MKSYYGHFRLGRWLLILFAISGVLLIYAILFASLTVSGVVRDRLNGQPIAGASITILNKEAPSSLSVHTGEDGRYTISGLRRGSKLVIKADRYAKREAVVIHNSPLDIDLEPLILSGTVKDAYTDAPIANAAVSEGGSHTTTDASGLFRLVRVKQGGVVTMVADGYAKDEISYMGQTGVEVALRPNVLSGKITEATSDKQIAGAKASVGNRVAVSGVDGTYKLTDIPPEPDLLVSAPGYEKSRITIARRSNIDVALKPFVVKAAYITMAGIGYQPMRDLVTRLIEETELNAIVIDVKDDDGSIAWRSNVPLAKAIGAQERITIPHPEGLIAELKKQGIYTIARIITFKDDLLASNGAKAGTNVAIIDERTGGPWKDASQGLGWVDPFRREVWDYNIAIAKEAAQKGFDEIQFDYIRFPADRNLRYAVFSQPNTAENRVKAISSFLAEAYAALKPLGVYVAVDVFGYASWQPDNVNLPLGQNIEEMGKYADFLCPMDYPSLFWYGLPMTPSYTPAENYPYEVVYYSVQEAIKRLNGLPVKVRPWIQYYNGSRRPYTAKDIELQKKAAIDAGAVGWMLWEPFVRYNKGGLVKGSD
ncbi:MAG: carboxypeptidase regulatory-like domain-containing protein [Chloroflexi bacterium]|nr:carboxypeptidase regulatory-like domain-containing protein [Chloroflexota bacterium]MCL5075359.1 carboxypeptidase regulatory-like domain-containing protein [Chloroflexota bacterium]